ncbi:CheY-like superfamily [Phycomyces nitens]|nr:CheY-like superfamily [Phycomyces nitens]
MGDVVKDMMLVKSGVKALEVLCDHQFDLILLDIDMPLLNGIDTAKNIRHSNTLNILQSNQTVPIIAVTTNDSPKDKLAYIKAGMNGCISKPVSPLVLRQTLIRLLDPHTPL